MLIIIKKYSIRMNKIWNNLSVVSKLLISFVVTVVIVIGVSAMIFWGRPVKMSDTKEIDKIKTAIELVDSVDSINITGISELSEMTDSEGNIINCQSVFYDSAKIKFIKVKKGFLKYKFDEVLN